MDIYKLYRNLWDFSFANPEKLKPNDIAIFSFAIEHCNRLGWKKKFGFPTSMAMEATGIKSYSVYKKHFDNLVANNFFEVIEYSKNQYSSNIIALKENTKALDKALDKALTKHTSKHSESTIQSIGSIDKQYNNTVNNITIERNNSHEQFLEKLLLEEFLGEKEAIEISCRVLIDRPLLENFNANLKISNKNHIHWSEYLKHLRNWIHAKPPDKVIKSNGHVSKFDQAIESHKGAMKLLDIDNP